MLKVKQNKIYEIIGDDEREIKLYGVNRAGLEWESRDGQILDSVKFACDDWHANIIRLPVSQDRWFGKMPEQNDENNAEKYRARVDEIIDAVAERGKYLLLDLHWSDLGLWNGKSGQHMMPDAHSLLFWQNAAARYRNHPNVLFGLYNEPHIDKKVDGEFGDPWHIWKFGGELREKETSYRAVGMQEMIDKVRSTGAKNVVVVGGLDWGYTLDGAVGENALHDPDGNGIILDSHVYPWKRLEWDLDIGTLDREFPSQRDCSVGSRKTATASQHGISTRRRVPALSNRLTMSLPNTMAFMSRNSCSVTTNETRGDYAAAAPDAAVAGRRRRAARRHTAARER